MTVDTEKTRVRNMPAALEWLFLIGLIGLCVYVWVTAGSYSERGAIWPRMVVGALTLAVVADLVLRMIPRRPTLPEEDAEEDSEIVLKGTPWGAYLGSILLVAVGAYLFGFLTVIPVFVVIFMLTRGYKTKPVSLVATPIILTVVLYIIFQEFANLPLTEGIWIQYELPQFL